MTKQAVPSDEALAFLAQERPMMPALTGETAHLFRASTRIETLPRSDRAVAMHSVEVSETTMADRPCLIVTPDT